MFSLHLAADNSSLSFWAEATIAKELGLREGDVIRGGRLNPYGFGGLTR